MTLSASAAEFCPTGLSVSRSIPSKTVVLGPKDHEYITPLIKSPLMQCNRLRRRGQPDKADVVAEKINTLISNDRADRLGKLNTATTTTTTTTV